MGEEEKRILDMLADGSITAEIAAPFVSRNQLVHLETAAAFVSVMRDEPDTEPFFIDVDDKYEKVQIYIG